MSTCNHRPKKQIFTLKTHKSDPITTRLVFAPFCFINYLGTQCNLLAKDLIKYVYSFIRGGGGTSNLDVQTLQRCWMGGGSYFHPISTKPGEGHCVLKWAFTLTFLGNQDATLK